MKRKVIITRGLPGSGKSTWSKQWTQDHPNFKRINRDDLRLMIYQGDWDENREKAVLYAREALIRSFLAHGYNLVLDDTNLVPWRMAETRNTIQECADLLHIPVEVEIKDFTDVPVEVCIERDAKRPDSTRVGEKFIREYYNKYVK
jgi:predicted kinase